MTFNPKLYLAKKKDVSFKDGSVADEFSSLTPETQAIATLGPARVTSGARSIEENDRVGGVPNSYHTKGEAFDVGLDSPQETLEKYKGAGFQVIKESDHYHVEPSKNKKDEIPAQSKPAFDPKQYIAKKRDLVKPDSVAGVDASGNNSSYFDSAAGAVRSLAKSASFGLTEPVAAAISTQLSAEKSPEETATSALLRGFGPIGFAADLVRSAKQYPEIYDKFRQKQYRSLKRQQDEHPVGTTIGDIAGYVLPGTAMSKVYGKAAEGASKIIPKVAGNVLKRGVAGVGRSLLRGGTAGAVAGAIDPEQDTTSGAVSGAIGDVVGTTLGKGVVKAGETAKSGAVRTINRMLGAKLKDLKRGNNIGEEIVQRGIESSPKNLKSIAQSGLDLNESNLDALLSANAGNKINPETVVNELFDLRKKFEGFPGNESEIKAIDDALDGIVNDSDKFLNVAPKNANEMKRSIYRKLTDSSYDKDSVPIKKDIMKATARGYRKAIEEVAPSSSKINKELSFYGRLNSAAEHALAKAEQGGANNSYYKLWRILRDVGLMTGGVMAGNPIAGAGAVALAEGLSSNYGKALSAKALSKISKPLMRGDRVVAPITGASIRYNKKKGDK